MKDSEIYNFTLNVEQSSERVDKLLSNHFPEYSRSTIQKWIQNKNVLIDGTPCSQNDKIKSSCNVQIKIQFEQELNLIPQNIKLDIIDDTEDYIIINKSSGMVTHIAPGNYKDTLQNALYFKYPELSKVPRTGIIHRLDKDTSGVIVVARSSDYHNYLTAQLHDKKFDKVYHAITTGSICQKIEINEKIGRHPVNRKKMSVNQKGKDAISIITPIDNYYNSSHLKIKIITGRTHQIRVHLSHHGNPIIGDKLYGYKSNVFVKNQEILNEIRADFNQYLHAYSLSFYDKNTESIKKYKAEYPTEYINLINVLKDESNK